ncbi:hypothetical protein DENSPDRAFT_844950 [Dentipellis sp. KUC8613]|nr:hypothetical protein DENSPDRAFT_844950 [Dentipellis sp. KUC8613]
MPPGLHAIQWLSLCFGTFLGSLNVGCVFSHGGTEWREAHKRIPFVLLTTLVLATATIGQHERRKSVAVDGKVIS